ncbi:unnamed protein product [Didymodactylos carnosus]|uniref:Uncharacterized protein n=1 Tax=Didymodactylos carnosus TaxID=1234261 RepID=A0A8S2KGM2_9BILA|nr:unnamed protein product [Didymodactylos carnosus]CAF3849192.1 unnamed protein product [Didymodactylos carnosus]
MPGSKNRKNKRKQQQAEEQATQSEIIIEEDNEFSSASTVASPKVGNNRSSTASTGKRSQIVDVGGTTKASDCSTIAEKKIQQPITTSEIIDVSNDIKRNVSPSEKIVIPKTTMSSFIINKTSLNLPEKPRKPGTLGQRILLFVNHFPVTLSSSKNLICYHYDFEVKLDRKQQQDRPVRIPKDLLQRIFLRWREDYLSTNSVPQELSETSIISESRNSYYHIIFDGKKNVFACQKLQNIDEQPCEFHTTIKNNPHCSETFIIQLKLVRSNTDMQLLQYYISGRSSLTVDDVQDQIQIMDILFRQRRLELNFVALNRSYFDLISTNENRVADLRNGQELWRGFFQTFRYSGKKLALNVDTSNTVFYKEQSVLDFIYDSFSQQNEDHGNFTVGRGRGGYQRGGLKIVTGHMRYEKIDWIGAPGQPPDQETFNLRLENQQNEIVTVLNYFQKTYPLLKLQYPKLPCIITRKRTQIPIELCTIVRQPVTRKLDPDVTAKIIPQYDDDPFLREWQTNITTQMPIIEGRILPSPDIDYGERKVLPGREVIGKGSWNMDNYKFYIPATIKNWAVLNLTNLSQDCVYQFYKQMMSMAEKMGLRVMNPEWADYIDNVRYSDRDLRNIIDALRALINHNKSLQLILCIVRNKTVEPYGTIKRLCDQELGIVTQCVQRSNVERANLQTMANIFLKVNPKLGGVNNSINDIFPFDKSRGGIMVVGADVSHAASSDNYSVAAVVASTDTHPSHYHLEICLQKHPKGGKSLEIIVQLKYMFGNCLKEYRMKNKSLPSVILFYRDGVSEGQFNTILRSELLHMQQACFEIDPLYRPRITLIVVQKRHHTRLFPADRKDECGKSKNIPPGTCVDQSITTPDNFDFYLCSHFGIQGTSRPTHYYVIFDENNFDFDKIQMITYKLCHMYARATRSVSIPAPVYYAHLAAFRGRLYIKNLDLDSFQRSGQRGDDQRPVDYVPLKIKENLVRDGLIII